MNWSSTPKTTYKYSNTSRTTSTSFRQEEKFPYDVEYRVVGRGGGVWGGGGEGAPQGEGEVILMKKKTFSFLQN